MAQEWAGAAPGASPIWGSSLVGGESGRCAQVVSARVGGAMSVAGGILRGMRISDLLAQPPPPVETWPTRLRALDALTGGFRRDSLWVVTGAPSSGKTTLLTQLAYVLAVRHGFTTEVHGSRVDPPESMRARLLSLALRRAPVLPDLDVALEPRDERQAAELEALRSASFSVSTTGGFALPCGDVVPERWCLAVDDPDGKRPQVLDESGRSELRKVADAGAVVLVAVPRGLCVESSGARERLREEWASVADLVMELVPGELGDTTLAVRLNRRGPLRDLAVLHQWHRARFVDAGVG